MFFSTLSNPTRLAIIQLLLEGPKTVNEIARTLDHEQSMISHNLKHLGRCGFVFVEPRWKERVYSINNETIEPLFETIKKHFNKYCLTKNTRNNCSKVNNYE